jgi:hypothetical protein
MGKFFVKLSLINMKINLILLLLKVIINEKVLNLVLSIKVKLK